MFEPALEMSLYHGELPLGEMLRGALVLDPRVYAEITALPQGFLMAMTVVALAGLSEALGQSLVLFINRVTPRRFGLALLLSVGTHVLGFIFWTTTVWLLGHYLFQRHVALGAVASAVGLASAPQLLGFFVLTPYLGSLLALIISVWSLLTTVVAVQVGLDLTVWQAVACSGVGWLLIQAWRRTLGRPVLALGRWLQRRTVGVPLRWTLRDLPRLRAPGPASDTVTSDRRPDGEPDG